MKEDEETIDTIGESINKILKLSDFISKNKINYKLAFKNLEYTLEEMIEEKKAINK